MAAKFHSAARRLPEPYLLRTRYRKGCPTASGKHDRHRPWFHVVDADGFSSQRHGVLRASRAIAFRWATVTLAAISWLAISNHCALGLATIESHGSEAVTAHDCCAGEMPAKPKPAKDRNAPCCKTLRATSAIAKAWQAGDLTLASAPVDFPSAILNAPLAPKTARRPLDTGPPGVGSFAESVLQRSLLAHAPPFLA